MDVKTLYAGIIERHKTGRNINWKQVAEELCDHFVCHVQTTRNSLGKACEALKFNLDPTVQKVRDCLAHLEGSVFEASRKRTVTRRRGNWIYEYELLGYEYDPERGRSNSKLGKQVSRRPAK